MDLLNLLAFLLELTDTICGLGFTYLPFYRVILLDLTCTLM
jgi:hypothetical protein